MLKNTPTTSLTYTFTVPPSLDGALGRIAAASGKANADVLARALTLYELVVTAKKTQNLDVALLDKDSKIQILVEGI
jgi:hypothetical protein